MIDWIDRYISIIDIVACFIDFGFLFWFIKRDKRMALKKPFASRIATKPVTRSKVLRPIRRQ